MRIQIESEQVLKVQQEWAAGIVKIGSLKENKRECRQFTENFLDLLYAFETGQVLFKPTKAAVVPFRNDKESALSYFIGGNDLFPEDHGFALEPWISVRFENNGLILEEGRALAMGNYFFTNQNGMENKVEFSFAYRLVGQELKIDLHHSSLPYSAGH